MGKIGFDLGLEPKVYKEVKKYQPQIKHDSWIRIKKRLNGRLKKQSLFLRMKLK